MKTLVVFYSRRGRARVVAENLSKPDDADLYEIKTVLEYNNGFGGYLASRIQVFRNNPVPIVPISVDLTKYERVIIVGSLWGRKIAAPIISFLKEARGKINKVEYVLIHFSRRDYYGTFSDMDDILGIHYSKAVSIVFRYGSVERIQRY